MPKTQTKRKDLRKMSNPLVLARARKPSGRLNKDDLANAISALKGASRPQLARVAKEIKSFQKSRQLLNKYSDGAISPISKGGLRKRKTGQTKGPAGKK